MPDVRTDYSGIAGAVAHAAVRRHKQRSTKGLHDSQAGYGDDMTRPPMRIRVVALVLLSAVVAIWWIGLATVVRWVF